MSGQPNQEAYLEDQITKSSPDQSIKGHESHSFTVSPAAFSLTVYDIRPTASEKFESDPGLCSSVDERQVSSFQVSDYGAPGREGQNRPMCP